MHLAGVWTEHMPAGLLRLSVGEFGLLYNVCFDPCLDVLEEALKTAESPISDSAQ